MNHITIKSSKYEDDGARESIEDLFNFLGLNYYSSLRDVSSDNYQKRIIRLEDISELSEKIDLLMKYFNLQIDSEKRLVKIPKIKKND